MSLAKEQRLQLIRRIFSGDTATVVPPLVAVATNLPTRRRWSMPPRIPLRCEKQHTALPNRMFTTLRSRS